MTPDPNFPRLAIRSSDAAQALEAGALDDCLHLLRSDEIDSTDAVRLNCRLGEILFHDGRREDAVECGRRAFALAPSSQAVLHFCAWLFSNCALYADAAAVYGRLLDRQPDWSEGYRHLSGSLAAAGERTKAIEFAIRASDLEPDRFEFALHAGSLLLDGGRADEATRYLNRALEIDPQHPLALRALSGAKWALGQEGEALDLAMWASAFAPGDSELAIHAAELLMRTGRIDDALAVLASAAEQQPNDAALWRMISAAEAQRERPEAALAAIGRAISLAPEAAEYHLHSAHLFYQLGDFAAAADALNEAARLDPASHAAQRAGIDLLLAEGRMTDATARGGELLRAFPEDDGAAEAVLRVLNRRLDTIDGEYAVVGEQAHRLPRRPRPPPGFTERLRTQGRVIQALVIRETRTRFGDSRLGYGWALLEPILHITLLWAMFSLLMHGQPPIGTHFFVFYLTGLVPYHLFVHISTSMTYGVTANGPVLQLPLVKPFDVILARGLLEFATDIAVAAILLTGFAACGLPALPHDPWSAASALGVTALLGCGVGFVNAVLQSLLRSWDRLWNNATRLCYFLSGIFYAPGMMPDWARDVLSWNPMLHAIDWVRTGFFDGYQPHWLDRRYLVVAAVVMLMAGMGLERGLRRRLGEPL